MRERSYNWVLGTIGTAVALGPAIWAAITHGDDSYKYMTTELAFVQFAGMVLAFVAFYRWTGRPRPGKRIESLNWLMGAAGLLWMSVYFALAMSMSNGKDGAIAAGVTAFTGFFGLPLIAIAFFRWLWRKSLRAAGRHLAEGAAERTPKTAIPTP